MAQLTAEQIARLLRGETWTDPNYGAGGYQYVPQYAVNGYMSPESGGTGQFNEGPITGFERIANLGGRRFSADTFDPQGNQTGTRNWQDGSLLQDALKGALLVGGAGMGFNALANAYGLGAAGAADAGLGGGGDLLDNMGGSAFDGPAADGLKTMGGLSDSAALNAVPDIAATGPVGLNTSMLTGISATIPAALGSATKAALYGSAGYGPGMTGAETAAYDAALPAAASGIGKSLADLAKTALPLVGAAAGAAGTPGTTTDKVSKLDPRMDQMVYGGNGQAGMLTNLMDWYQANKSGQNDTMRQAQQGMKSLLTDPNVLAAIYGQGAAGQNLMRQPVAGNPFANWRP